MRALTICVLLCVCALYVTAQPFAGVSIVYRFDSSVPPSSIKFIPDQIKRRGVLINYSGSDVVRVGLDSYAAVATKVQNSNSQGAGFIESNSDVYYGLSCNGNDVYLYTVNLVTMVQNSTTKITAFTCEDLPSCAVYDPISKIAVFATAKSGKLGTINAATSTVSVSSTTLLNDNKFSCTYDSTNRTAYFSTTSPSFSTIDMTKTTLTINPVPIQGFLSTRTYSSPVILFDSVNSALFMTVKYTQNVPDKSFTILRYQPTISNWTTLQGASSLGQGTGLMIDTRSSTPYVFTPANSLVYADSTFQTAVENPINRWSLMGQGLIDTVASTATTNGFATVSDLAQLVRVKTSAASVASSTFCLLFVILVCLFINV